MVLEASFSLNRPNPNMGRTPESKKASFQAMQQLEKNNSSSGSGKKVSNGHPQQQGVVNGKYGAWGPVFKNRDHFVEMHLH